LEGLLNTNEDELIAIRDVGDFTARAIMLWLSNRDNRDMIHRLLKMGINPVYKTLPTVETRVTPLTGKQVAFTGTFGDVKRNDLANRAKEAGAIVHADFRSTLDYLVAGQNARGKLEKAQAAGIAVLSLEQFNDLLEAPF
jgi:DNA ligase (NAD+)